MDEVDTVFIGCAKGSVPKRLVEQNHSASDL